MLLDMLPPSAFAGDGAAALWWCSQLGITNDERRTKRVLLGDGPPAVVAIGHVPSEPPMVVDNLLINSMTTADPDRLG